MECSVSMKASFHDQFYVISTSTRIQTPQPLHFQDLIFAEEDQSHPFQIKRRQKDKTHKKLKIQEKKKKT